MKNKMNAISKPHLVDLLRIFDKRRYITPRIRYASVLRAHPGPGAALRDELRERNRGPDAAQVSYFLKEKAYTFDGQAVDVPRKSREKIQFQISR